MLRHHQIAGTPLELKLLPVARKRKTKSIDPGNRGTALTIRNQGNDLGYSKNVSDWAIRSQVLYKLFESLMDAVHRLNVGGSLRRLKI